MRVCIDEIPQWLDGLFHGKSQLYVDDGTWGTSMTQRPYGLGRLSGSIITHSTGVATGWILGMQKENQDQLGFVSEDYFGTLWYFVT